MKSSSVLTALLAACVIFLACENSPAAPTQAQTPAASVVTAPSAPASVTVCAASAVTAFRPNVGTDGFVSWKFDAQSNVNVYEVEVERRKEGGTFGYFDTFYVRTGDLASSRWQPPARDVWQARIRAVTACNTFGPTSTWVLFTN